MMFGTYTMKPSQLSAKSLPENSVKFLVSVIQSLTIAGEGITFPSKTKLQGDEQ